MIKQWFLEAIMLYLVLLASTEAMRIMFNG